MPHPMVVVPAHTTCEKWPAWAWLKIVSRLTGWLQSIPLISSYHRCVDDVGSNPPHPHPRFSPTMKCFSEGETRERCFMSQLYFSALVRSFAQSCAYRASLQSHLRGGMRHPSASQCLARSSLCLLNTAACQLPGDSSCASLRVPAIHGDPVEDGIV